MKVALVFLLLVGVLSAATSADWAARLDRTVRAVQSEFSAPQLNPAQLAITVIDLRQPQAPRRADYRGAERFYPAEDYHQNYYANNPNAGYCRIVISPKVEKVRSKFTDKLKK